MSVKPRKRGDDPQWYSVRCRLAADGELPAVCSLPPGFPGRNVNSQAFRQVGADLVTAVLPEVLADLGNLVCRLSDPGAPAAVPEIADPRPEAVDRTDPACTPSAHVRRSAWRSVSLPAASGPPTYPWHDDLPRRCCQMHARGDPWSDPEYARVLPDAPEPRPPAMDHAWLSTVKIRASALICDYNPGFWTWYLPVGI